MTTPRKPRPHEPKQEKENFTVTVDLSKTTGVRNQVELNILCLVAQIQIMLYFHHYQTHLSFNL